MIEIEHLAKNYREKEVLRGLSFTAAAHEITMLIGPNGAGKTTAVKILAGLVRPSGGLARIQGWDVSRARRQAQRTLSYLPQRPEFHPRFTSLQILRFYGRLRGVHPSRAEAVLEFAGLRDEATIRTGELSGGLRQRLGLALLLLPDAPVLLLDEPGLSLDPTWRKRLQDTLRFEAERGKTVLLTTHLIGEWNNIAHRCLLCRDGRIEKELDPSNLVNEPEIFALESSPETEIDHELRLRLR
jgi:ABC-type multidrug transport system ATPase subunit